VQNTTTLSILDCTNAVDGGGWVLHVAQRFERFLETYRRPDGQRWGGAALEKATGGVVSRSYATNLRKGRMENPGYEKMRAIAKAMGFPPQVWWFRHEGIGSQKGGPQRQVLRWYWSFY
jgi:transcriptional regulator with XRE-family HTH domain